MHTRTSTVRDVEVGTQSERGRKISGNINGGDRDGKEMTAERDTERLGGGKKKWKIGGGGGWRGSWKAPQLNTV